MRADNGAQAAGKRSGDSDSPSKKKGTAEEEVRAISYVSSRSRNADAEETGMTKHNMGVIIPL